jgi:hypothetical protein
VDKSNVGKSAVLLVAAVVTAIQGFYVLAAVAGVLGIGLLAWSLLKRRDDKSLEASPPVP